MSKIPFRVCYCSNQHSDYPADELNFAIPEARGWQSTQFCDYPVEIGLEMETVAMITRFQVISHHKKISKKLELHAGLGNSYENAKWKYLGHMSLRSNEDYNFAAREMKSSYIRASGNFFKIRVFECHINEFNSFNQVGLIAVNLLGEPGEMESESPLRLSKTNIERLSQLHETDSVSSFSSNKYNKKGVPKNDLDDLTFSMNIESGTAQHIRQVVCAKENAVRKEDYDGAKALKEFEVELRELGNELAQLEVSKIEAVEDEDYEHAKELKIEAQHVRDKVNQIVNSKKFNELMKAVLTPNSPPILGMSQSDISTRLQRDVSFQNSVQHSKSNLFDRSISTVYDEPGNIEEDANRSVEDQIHVNQRTNQALEGSMRGSVWGSLRGSRSSFDGKMGIEDMPLANSMKGSMARVEPFVEEIESFKGEHPLKGVPNLANLPSPEQLSIRMETAELIEMQHFFGDYVTRCLYSKTWSLREAAIVKTRLLLPEFEGAIEDNLHIISQVIRIGSEDKMAQVFASSVDLLKSLVDMLSTLENIRLVTFFSIMEPVVHIFIQKLGDGQGRVRDAGMDGLMSLASFRSLLPTVASIALKPLPTKLITAWRPITARMQYITFLLNKYGLDNVLTVDSVMTFIKSCNGFAHSHADVREASKLLTATVHKYTKEAGSVERHLSSLRPKQLKEYLEAFEGQLSTVKMDVSPEKLRSRRTSKESTLDPNEDSRPKLGSVFPASLEHSTHKPSQILTLQDDSVHNNDLYPKVEEIRGGSNSMQDRDAFLANIRQITRTQSPYGGENIEISSVIPQNQETQHSENNQESSSISNICEFCGKYVMNFPLNKIDDHYWSECPYLTPCPECKQVVELPVLTFHLLEECVKAVDVYEECKITGLAIKCTHIDRWKKSPFCKPPSELGSLCPLCYHDMGCDSQIEDWRNHLFSECKQNPRNQTLLAKIN